jgi:hypothetical protein
VKHSLLSVLVALGLLAASAPAASAGMKWGGPDNSASAYRCMDPELC